MPERGRLPEALRRAVETDRGIAQQIWPEKHCERRASWDALKQPVARSPRKFIPDRDLWRTGFRRASRSRKDALTAQSASTARIAKNFRRARWRARLPPWAASCHIRQERF